MGLLNCCSLFFPAHLTQFESRALHLKHGDPKPKIRPNYYTLFGFRFCPFVERVRLILEYYKIPHDVIWISLHSKPDWYLEIYPIGKVPLLITKEGQAIAESDVIMRHLDESVGHKRLISLCGEAEFQRAEKLVFKLTVLYYGILYGAHFTENDASNYRSACQEVNDAIKGPCFSGRQLTMTDFLLLSHLNRFEPVMARLDGVAPKDIRDLEKTDPNGKRWPQLATYLKMMRRLPFVESVRESAITQALYAQTFRQGLPNPDI